MTEEPPQFQHTPATIQAALLQFSANLAQHQVQLEQLQREIQASPYKTASKLVGKLHDIELALTETILEVGRALGTIQRKESKDA